jgi:signal recognition particle subunit SRP68
MELKKENEQQVDLARRRHAIKRLRKAAIWAAELAAFATDVCDTRSALETEAYSSWLHGAVLLEKETDWEGALTKFGRAK